MHLIIFILLIFAILLVIFTLQNQTDITLNVFFWEIADVPLVLILISCVVIGYLIAAIYLYPLLWKKKKEYNQLLKLNKELKELHGLNQEKVTPPEEEETNPEGIELDDDDDNSFFKD